MNPSLPKGSFYPFTFLIRPMERPTWFGGGEWSVTWERVAEFLERLREEPITAGLGPYLPYRLLPGYRIDAVARECQRMSLGSPPLSDSQLALRVMHAIAELRPFTMGDPERDPQVNLRAIFYAGAFIARERHAEHCRTCPMAGRHCGDGTFCSRHTVENFFDRRPALNDPQRALAQLDDMRRWGDDDFLRLVQGTTLSESGCVRYARSRVVR